MVPPQVVLPQSGIVVEVVNQCLVRHIILKKQTLPHCFVPKKIARTYTRNVAMVIFAHCNRLGSSMENDFFISIHPSASDQKNPIFVPKVI